MAKLVAAFVACMGVAGCGLPAPPQRVNAVLPKTYRSIANHRKTVTTRTLSCLPNAP